MSAHVDVVRNEWLTGEQHAVARLFVTKDELQIDSPDRARWLPVVEQALDELDLREEDPATVLEILPERLRGSHLFATPPHDRDSCPYEAWGVVKMESVSSERSSPDRQPAHH